MQNLTLKEEKFAQLYVSLQNATEAYKQAYNAEGMTTQSVRVTASKLKNSARVEQRVREIQAEFAARNNVTLDSLTSELEAARLDAIKLEQISAAISATMGKAKLHGFLVERAKLDASVVINVDTGIVRDPNN